MRFSLTGRLGSSSAEDATFSPPTNHGVVSRKSDRHLSFWHIRHHDRESLIDRIIPHMAEPVAETYFLQTIIDQHPWAVELIKSELAEPIGDDSDCFQQTTATFWHSPASMAVDLQRLTRVWFFILLRYTYRCRFFEGREVSRSNLDIQILCNSRSSSLYSNLTEATIHRLTRLRSKYGASYYRGSYKDTKRRLGWTSFCGRIRSFCQSIGLHTSSKDPGKNLRELRRNLTPIMMHRKLSYVNGQLSKSIVLVRNTRRNVKKLDERVTSGAMYDDEMIEEMKQEMKELNSRIENLQLTRMVTNEPRCKDTQSFTEITDICTAYEKRFEELGCGMQKNNEISGQRIRSLQGGVAELRNELDQLRTCERDKTTAEALVLCRWLLEHLPAGYVKQDGLSFRWKRFWQLQWDRCQKLKLMSHPLWELVGDENYNKVGQSLYSTLSRRIHGYGAQRGDELRPDIQRVVDAIKPVYYDDDGKIDLTAERTRWKN